MHWTRALRACSRIPATWPGFFVNVGIGGSYLAFAGLWAVPYLVETYGMSRVAAAQHASLLLLGVAFGSVIVGASPTGWGIAAASCASTRCCTRCRGCRGCCTCSGRCAATLAWFLLMGLLIPGFTLTWAVAKEVNRPEHSGIATVVVNVGIFLGTGILQPLVGWRARSRSRGRRSRRRVGPRHLLAAGAARAAFGALR